MQLPKFLFLYQDTGKEEESLVVMIDIDDAVASDEDFEQLPARKSSALDEAFLVAKESWNILHANETYEKGFLSIDCLVFIHLRLWFR